MASYDTQHIRNLAIKGRDGDPVLKPPTESTSSATAIAVRIVDALRAEYGDKNADDPTRNRAFANIVGLALLGARSPAARLLREGTIKVTRQGDTIRIKTGWAVPASVAQNTTADTDTKTLDEPASGQVYIQFDFMSWAVFHNVHAQIRKLGGGIAAVEVTFVEIAKLEPLYPNVFVGEAMRQAGLGIKQDKLLDLAAFLADKAPDLGVIDDTADGDA